MEIGLINVDSVKIPNLALEKVRRYHLDRGDKVEDVNHFAPYDVVYKSKVFTGSPDNTTEVIADEVLIGGSGYDVQSKLPREIEMVRPRINLDFATRGCIRKCSFCIVSQKEGPIRADRDLYDIWDGKSRHVTLLDNNILALPDHFRLICEQAIKEKVTLDFNQGLDIRLITDESAELLSRTRMKEIRFALDENYLIPTFDKKLKILRKYIPRYKFAVYVLVGYNSTIEQDLERLIYLKENRCVAFVMNYGEKNKEYTMLADWANQRKFFRSMDFDEFKIKRREWFKRHQPTQSETLFN